MHKCCNIVLSLPRHHQWICLLWCSSDTVLGCLCSSVDMLVMRQTEQSAHCLDAINVFAFSLLIKSHRIKHLCAAFTHTTAVVRSLDAMPLHGSATTQHTAHWPAALLDTVCLSYSTPPHTSVALHLHRHGLHSILQGCSMFALCHSWHASSGFPC